MNADKFVEVLKLCESAGGAGKKKAIQDALAKLDITGQTLMHYAMDPYITFGIKKVDKSQLVYADTDGSVSDFFELLNQLSARELTGDAARNAWLTMLATFTEETASYLERVIDKDPRGGFSADTFNKVWADNKIPTFEVMLADKCDSVEEFEKRVSLPAWAAQKYDGHRTIAIVRENPEGGVDVEFRSRQGKPMDHLNGLFDNDFAAMFKVIGTNFIADGEAFATDFTETQNAKKEGNDEAKANMRFRLFFVMPLSDWVAQKTDITMGENLENCWNLMNKVCYDWDDSNGPRKVLFEDGKMVNTYAEMTEYCNYVIDECGEEGLIVKELTSPYIWDRDFAWTKVKRFFDADLQIIGFYPGKPKSRLANTLGGVWAAGILEDGTLVVTGCGSGFSDKDRDEIWNNKDKYLGAMMVGKYQEVSKAKGKDTHSLRFCTFEHFRDDKSYDFTDEQMELIKAAIK